MNEQSEQKAATPTEVTASNPFNQANEKMQAFIKTPDGKLEPTTSINTAPPSNTPDRPSQPVPQMEVSTVPQQEKVQIMNKADLVPVTPKVESGGLFGRIRKILGK